MGNGRKGEKKQDGRQHRADGERSRQAILKAAAELATTEGLDGLSIGRLAEHVGMSKSGLFAHFKSKEELQIAAIDAANEIFHREVWGPGMNSKPGVARIVAQCESFFSHLERKVFPGGCFFVSAIAELDGKEGRIRDHVLALYSRILASLTEIVREAQELGEIRPDENVTQLVFELDSVLLGVNYGYVFFRDPGALDRGRTAIRNRLERAAPVRQTKAVKRAAR
jgi:AcrR family transcriptional regulator